MAVARPIPTCPYCGKPTARGVYQNQKGIPFMMRMIGDTFIRWEFKECNCKGARKARREREKLKRERGIDINKIIRGK